MQRRGSLSARGRRRHGRVTLKGVTLPENMTPLARARSQRLHLAAQRASFLEDVGASDHEIELAWRSVELVSMGRRAAAALRPLHPRGRSSTRAWCASHHVRSFGQRR